MDDEQFSKNLERFKTLLDILRGKVDLKSNLEILEDPDNLKTMSRLTDSQVNFVLKACWFADQWDIFSPLRDLAFELMLANISLEGKGREEIIKFANILQLGKATAEIRIGGEEEKRGLLARLRGKGEKT